MIRLHTLPPAWGLPTFTPFGLKLAAHMTLAEIPYGVVYESNPGRGPNKKVPWIVDDGQVIADSAFIVEHLEGRYGDSLDGWLSVEQRATAHALRRMVEEGLCFSVLHARWLDRSIYRQAVPVALSGVPSPLRGAIAPIVHARITRDLWGQGIGRLSHEQAARLGCKDLDVVAQQLGARPFMMGDRACSLDAVMLAFLAVILLVPLDTALKRHATRHAHLVSYADRMLSLFHS
jgi:glutathione S-transferase